MGRYLNGKNAYMMYQEDFSLTYFVDKTDILDELMPLLEVSFGSDMMVTRCGRVRGCIIPARSSGR